ncbi:hypothetical protein Lcho_4076 [Leptothrix cholodnii SP-6]|uniref:Uncharacterized protein n=1 Tax=Leptothrix cholodnii (strain ATCC 51168 / LMG 8142 / SP-6) TaxID=395495 RepID=B1XWX9_LEPCP|nr:hypothetical protein [Leptothrix cholodnii]ACB36328.1 hypothetical protein Lcho_4076 [Leptothrix cholodnii SP-6]
MGGHNRAKFKDDFCAVAAQPSCGCSINADYVAVCRPNWPDHAFVRKIKGNPNPPPKSFEAHHILCAASVGVMIVDAGGKGVGKLVGDTEWCINTRKNMIAMPLWGHTVKWYCNIPAVTLGAANRKAPPFKNLPQHDWDHTGNGGYQEEVDADLRDVVKDLKKAGHDTSTFDLAGELDALSSKFKSALKARGKRSGGTHAGWQAGRAAPNSQWYAPFSMAASVTAKGYPKLNFTQETMNKLKWLAKQLK